MDAPNVSLPNENTSMVNALRETELEDLSLETALQEILNLQRQHVIQSHTALIEHTDTNETTDEGISFEKTFGVLVVEFEQFTGSTTDFGKDESDTPDFALVTETVFTCELDVVFWC